ncbi:MAG: gliding motility-associated C-terminal domain-containing protein [Bacteroidales bacterium]
MKKFLLSISIFFLCINIAKATHQRAAELMYKHVKDLTYEFTLISYTYTLSETNANRDQLEIKWGDGSKSLIERIEVIQLPYQISYNKYVTRHTFPGPGSYIISMEDPNRNDGVVNIPNSVNTPMFIQSMITINPFIGVNNSVRLLNAPVDMGCVNKLFVHNPGAFDIDGDSIAYKLVNCRGAEGFEIPGFKLPKYSTSFHMDAITGDLIWDAPIIQGEYNIAFRVEEWRNGLMIGYVTRDMQIEILSCDNDPPIIRETIDTCIVAGDQLKTPLSAFDPNDDVVTLTCTGGPFEVAFSPAKIEPFPAIGKPEAKTHLIWDTHCKHLRKEMYNVSIKAIDDGIPIHLVDYGNYRIKVIPAPIEGINIDVKKRAAIIQWDKFACNNIKGYRIFRKNGPYYWDPDYCETGLPKSSGYKLIKEINDINTTTFTDDNESNGLLYGNIYCYRINSILPDNNDGKVSEEVCVELKNEVPIITNISNEVKEIEDGKIKLVWSKPTEIDKEKFPAPYHYEVYRRLPSMLFEKIAGPIAFNDTTFNDLTIDINEYKEYTKYRIDLFSQQTKFAGSSDPASSMLLEGNSGDEKVELKIKANVPWTIDSTVFYRKKHEDFKYDSIIRVAGNQYIDKNVENEQEYCYYAKTYGHYDSKGIIKPLINYSNFTCITPIDNEPPCSPILEVETNCNDISNTLTWNSPEKGCPEDIAFYSVFYSPSAESEFDEIAVIEDINDTTYVHDNISDVIGCYYILATDSVGNTSKKQNPICIGYEVCPIYKLPNYFTPNGDGINDVFYPIDYDKNNPKATVESIDMKIFNRWGRILFETKNPEIAWTGKDQDNNQDLAEGVYYYTCKVNLKTLQGKDSFILKGIITIFR